MKTITIALAKGSMATIAAGAMAATSATPAFARDRDDGGIDAGDIIAGAVILGGIAIAAGALGGGRDRYDDRRYGYDGYDDRRYGYDGYDDRRYGYDRYARQGNPRAAVQRCIAAAENTARRYGYRYANVTEVRDVDQTRYGFRVRGNLVVEDPRSYRGALHDRYDRYDRRGHQSVDQGRFTCQVDRGQIRDIRYNGIRGLR